MGWQTSRDFGKIVAKSKDKLGFAFLERCKLSADNSSVLASRYDEGCLKESHIPAGVLSCLFLGAGSSVTHSAVMSLSNVGCSLMFIGKSAVGGTFMSKSTGTKLLEKQSCFVSDPELRLVAARRMYEKRFKGMLGETLTPADIGSLQGWEGARMRAFYDAFCRKYRISGWKRRARREEQEDVDPVNAAMTFGNHLLYGVVSNVVLSLGMSPGLGVIHRGNHKSFVLDIADIYKTRIIVPKAFELHNSSDPIEEMRKHLSQKGSLMTMLPTIVDDIFDILGLKVSSDEWESDSLEWFKG